jgi:hypothetical protein
MSTATTLMIIGVLIALLGAALGFRARLQARSAAHALSTGAPVDDFDDVLERIQTAYRTTDAALRSAVALMVVGVLIAGVGAYLGSSARALGADVGGSGTTDRARVGGSW